MEKKDKGTIALQVVAITLVVLAVVGIILFMVFNKPQPHKDIDTSYAGKYELTEVSGLIDHGTPITPASYDYNYIELNANGRYEIANKYKGKKTSQKGIWYVKDNTVHLESSKMLGLVKTHDSGDIRDGKITMTLKSDSGDIVMVMTKK